MKRINIFLPTISLFRSKLPVRSSVDEFQQNKLPARQEFHSGNTAFLCADGASGRPLPGVCPERFSFPGGTTISRLQFGENAV